MVSVNSDYFVDPMAFRLRERSKVLAPRHLAGRQGDLVRAPGPAPTLVAAIRAHYVEVSPIREHDKATVPGVDRRFRVAGQIGRQIGTLVPSGVITWMFCLPAVIRRQNSTFRPRGWKNGELS